MKGDKRQQEEEVSWVGKELVEVIFVNVESEAG